MSFGNESISRLSDLFDDSVLNSPYKIPERITLDMLTGRSSMSGGRRRRQYGGEGETQEECEAKGGMWDEDNNTCKMPEEPAPPNSKEFADGCYRPERFGKVKPGL